MPGEATGVTPGETTGVTLGKARGVTPGDATGVTAGDPIGLAPEYTQQYMWICVILKSYICGKD